MKTTSLNFRSLKSCVLWMLTVSALSFSVSAQTIIFSNNFDSLTVGQSFTSTPISGMTGNADATHWVEVSNATSHSGSNSLYQYDGADGTPSLNVNLGQTYTNVDFSIAININSTSTINFYDSSSNLTFALCHEGSVWELRNASNAILINLQDSATGFTSNAWHTVSASFNEATNSFIWKIDGVSVLNNTSGAYDSINWSVYRFSITTGWWSGGDSSRSGFYDDIIVTAIPEPGTIAMLAISLIALACILAMKKRHSNCAA